MHLNNTLALVVLAISLGLLGCTKSSDKGAIPVPAAGDASEGAHAHGEWWCNEHGLPEEVCTQCNAKLVADFRAKGDWCKEHDVPDSQCFICHPEKEAEFAAQYEAKFGKMPPKPEIEN